MIEPDIAFLIIFWYYSNINPEIQLYAVKLHWNASIMEKKL